MMDKPNVFIKLCFKILVPCLLFSSVFLTSCEEEYPFGRTPEISLLNYGPDTIQEFLDSVYFSVSYQDGDGDLGENDTDEHNLIVTDLRNSIRYTYRIRALVPGGAEVPIKGVLNFSISNTFITNGASQESVSYSIQLKDRAGNSSNTVTTGPILIIQ